MELEQLKQKFIVIRAEISEWVAEDILPQDVAVNVALMILEDCIKREQIVVPVEE